MKAVRFHKLGGPEVLCLEEVAEPEAQEGQVVVRVAAAGVNYADLNRTRGIYPVKETFPATLGSEVAGTIEEVGPGVDAFKRGDKVMAWADLGGCYAESVAASVDGMYRIPAGLSFEEAAGMPIVSLTAYHLLKTRARVQPGETVLVQAAASGVGTIAVQLAKLWGARVLATASSDEKIRRVLDLGADLGINYARDDFVLEVLRATDERGVEVVLEAVGGEVLTKSIGLLQPLVGRVVFYGRSSGSLPQLDAADIFTRNIAVISLHLGMPPWKASMHREAMSELIQLVEAGKIKPIHDRSFPLKDTADAHRYVAARRTIGKVVLVP